MLSKALRPFALLSVLLLPALASADAGSKGFVENVHGKLNALLKQSASASRETQITAEMDAAIDYDVLARRTFGDPCPIGIKTCTNHWKDLTDAQKAETKDLLKKIVQKNYRKNLNKTMNFNVTFENSVEIGSDTRVRTIAKHKTDVREAPVTIDYIVNGSGGNYHIVDIVTESSSLAKNYYTQFHKMLTTDGQGYPYVVKKLNDKLAKP
ncbi:MAG: ABC transporter substrate-binding protein [Polyangiaceae bacterium]